MEILNKIQKTLKAPKNQYNSFGKYKYRSCEDILESVKPLLGDAIITLTDEIIREEKRYYVKATATIISGENKISASAYARESVTKKGMDSAQITGAASSYARKYALNGLLLIDDTKDADVTNQGKENFISEKQVSNLLDIIDNYDINKDKFLEYMKVDDIRYIKENDYQKAIKSLEIKIKKDK